MRRRTLEEKLEAIRLVEAGNSPRSVSDRLHINMEYHEEMRSHAQLKINVSYGLRLRFT